MRRYLAAINDPTFLPCPLALLFDKWIMRNHRGGMAERLNAPVLKTGIG